MLVIGVGGGSQAVGDSPSRVRCVPSFGVAVQAEGAPADITAGVLAEPCRWTEPTPSPTGSPRGVATR